MEYFCLMLHFYSTKVLISWIPTNIFKNLFLSFVFSSVWLTFSICDSTLCTTTQHPGSSEFSSQHLPSPLRFPCHQSEHLIVRKSGERKRLAEVSGILAGNNHVIRTIDRLYPIKQENRPVDDVSHLFRAVFTLRLNHITGAAVQPHFGRLQCLCFSFFSFCSDINIEMLVSSYNMLDKNEVRGIKNKPDSLTNQKLPGINVAK